MRAVCRRRRYPQHRAVTLDVQSGRSQHPGSSIEVVEPHQHRRPSSRREHLVDAPAQHEPPTVDDRHSLARLLDLGEQVAGQEHGASRGAEPAQQPICRIPAGSSPLTGSSSTSRAGSFNNAAASPNRWRIPSSHPASPRSTMRRDTRRAVCRCFR